MEMKLVIRGIAKTGNMIYLVPGYLNGIIAVDLATCTTHFISIPEKGHRVGQDLYEDILVSDGLIWCSPCTENQIAVYDSSKQMFKYFPLPELTERGRDLFRCGNMYEIGENIIILPQEYPGILKVNKSNFEMKAVGWKEHLYQKNKEDFVKRMYALAKDCEIVDDTIYLLDKNYILMYNEVDDSIKYISVCSDHKELTGIAKFGDKFILIDRLHAELFEWTPEGNVLKKINIDFGYGGTDTENEEGDGCPVGLVRTKDRVIIMLAASKYLYLLDEEYRIEKVELPLGEIEKYEAKWHYRCYEFDGKNLYLPICYENKILVIDTDTWDLKSVQIDLSENDAEKIFSDAMTTDKPMTENALFYSLEHFLDKLMES